MSKMTKFLKQKTTLQLMQRTKEGEPVLNEYGEPLYQSRITVIKCRKEISTQDVITTVGAAKKSATIFYLDNTNSIAIGDKLEGKPILTVQEYINSQGLCEGYEVMV